MQPTWLWRLNALFQENRRMRKTIVWLVLSVLFLCNTVAQGKSSTTKDVEQTKKEAYLKDKLKLTPEQDALFWPVYHQRYLDLKANSRHYKSLKIEKKLSEMTEEECKKQMENKFAKDTKQLEIEKLYHDKFVAIIGYKKTAKLYKEEDDYKDELKAKEAAKSGASKGKK
jgi:hypothetical protein